MTEKLLTALDLTSKQTNGKTTFIIVLNDVCLLLT